MSLATTELAVATAGEVLHLFFQDGQNILEARSPDGGQVWITQDAIIAKDANYSGSAMTSYYVDKDANFNHQPTIHLLYMNSSNHLAEKVKRMSGDSPIWESVSLSDDVKKGPEPNSRLTGGAFNSTQSGWNPNGSQWAYFSTIKEANQCITEIRRTPSGAWYTETVLPENWGDALPGTSLACTISYKSIKVFFQDHDYNICLYEHSEGKWHARGTYIDKKTVQASTPLAVTRTNDGKTHLFYAGKSNKIIHATDYSDTEELVNFYSGSKLGATSVSDKITLFYRNLNPVGEVSTLENDGTWQKGTTVVPAPSK
jgi:hypothetical protein